MALKLMYITNNPDVARIAEEAGVDRIFVDMEYIGKADRQGYQNVQHPFHAVFVHITLSSNPETVSPNRSSAVQTGFLT